MLGLGKKERDGAVGTHLTTPRLVLRPANIFDFDDDIYYETISIHLIARIRDEKKFGSLDLLKKQLSEDRESISKMLI